MRTSAVVRGTFVRASAAHRRTAIESMIEADPIANAYADLWPSEAHGREAPQTFYAQPILPVTRCKRRLAKNAMGAHRPTAAGADVPADARHRGYLLSRMPSRNENDQRDECRTYRQQHLPPRITRSQNNLNRPTTSATRNTLGFGWPVLGVGPSVTAANDADGADASAFGTVCARAVSTNHVPNEPKPNMPVRGERAKHSAAKSPRTRIRYLPNQRYAEF